MTLSSDCRRPLDACVFCRFRGGVILISILTLSTAGITIGVTKGCLIGAVVGSSNPFVAPRLPPYELGQMDALAGVFWRHGMALELVCRADFWCNRHCKTSPVDLDGSGGQVWPKIGRKPTHKFPARLPSGTQIKLQFCRGGRLGRGIRFPDPRIPPDRASVAFVPASILPLPARKVYLLYVAAVWQAFYI